MRRVVTFGTFDVFHVGHVHLLRRAKALGDWLSVGISSDQLNLQKKGRAPVYSLASREEIISALKFVDAVFVEHSLAKKREYIIQQQADMLVMGDDWQGRFDEFNDICQVVYLPRTPSVSTTELIEVIRDIPAPSKR